MMTKLILKMEKILQQTKGLKSIEVPATSEDLQTFDELPTNRDDEDEEEEEEEAEEVLLLLYEFLAVNVTHAI